MRNFLAVFVGCLISACVVAAEKVDKVDGDDQRGVEIELERERADCEPDRDAWRCNSPEITDDPRIVQWEEEGDSLTLELGLSNFEHAQIEEIDARTNTPVRIVWEMESAPDHAHEPIQASIVKSPIAGRSYRLTVRNPHNAFDPLVQDVFLPGISDSFETNLEVLPENVSSDTPLVTFVPVAPDLLCDVQADPWGCKQPIVHGLEIPDQERRWITSTTEFPMGYILNLGVTVENAGRIVVESLNYPLYSPLSLVDQQFIQIAGQPGAGGRQTVNFQMRVFKQSSRIRIRAINGHGTATKTEIIHMNSVMRPTISGAQWVDRKGMPLTTVDSDQEVFLELANMRFSDSVRLALSSDNIKCEGSFFLGNSKSKHLMGLNRMLGRHGTRIMVPVVLKNCPGESHAISVLVSPGQVEWFPESEKRLSKPLKIDPLTNAQPKIIRASLEVDGNDFGLPKGSFLIGAKVKLNVEAIDADELVVRSLGNKQIAYTGGQANNHVDSHFPIIVDRNFAGGFDLIARTPNNPRSDTQRFFPKVLRKAKLTVPVTWQGQSTPNTKNASVTCTLHPKGKMSLNHFYATRTLNIKVNGRPSAKETLVFDLEGQIRSSEKPSDVVSITCTALGDHSGQGLGSHQQDTGYTFGSWPFGVVAISSKPFKMRVP